MSTFVFFRRISASLCIRALACLAITTSAAQAESLLTESHNPSFLLAEKKPKRKGVRKSKRKPVEQDNNDVNQNVSSSISGDSLAAKTSARGILGILPQLQTTLIFGAGVTMPYSKTVVLDHGGDYFKVGNELFSISVLRIGGGAAYIFSQSADSMFLGGGRAGLAMVSASSQFLGETTSSSDTGIFAELRAIYETKVGGLLLGGELQLPIILGKGSGSNFLAVYGTLGMQL